MTEDEKETVWQEEYQKNEEANAAKGLPVDSKAERKNAVDDRIVENDMPKRTSTVEYHERRHYVNYVRAEMCFTQIERMMTDDHPGVDDGYTDFNREARENMLELIRYWRDEFFRRGGGI